MARTSPPYRSPSPAQLLSPPRCCMGGLCIQHVESIDVSGVRIGGGMSSSVSGRVSCKSLVSLSACCATPTPQPLEALNAEVHQQDGSTHAAEQPVH
ncbi:hypothetical protein E2C01_009307 [Portunus trituberculatus]|uniref:Uncharacterized protein n=1 Tax=Portunus trituberculatus TaxID=210409 RepID=A0A5B7D364_PORTR|nr:hypothetical protein [Portunus trituberculatus]